MEETEGGEAGMRRALLVVGLLVLCQTAAAFHVSTIVVDPSGSLIPCDPVHVSFSISFPVTSGETFPADNYLEMQTDLERPRWSWSIDTGGMKKSGDPVTGRTFSLKGTGLSSPSTVNESMTVMLSGEAPWTNHSQNITLITIFQTDAAGNVTEDSVTTLQRMVVDTCCINYRCQGNTQQLKTGLRQLRTIIDQNASRGVGVSDAETRYAEAQQNITAAEGRQSTEYQEAIDELDAASAAIADGERLLDRAWAEKEVADAQEKADEAGEIIGRLRENSSTANNGRLTSVITNREIAVSYISAAGDLIDSGSYGLARENAHDAYLKANESYQEGLFIQQNPPHIIWDPPPKRNIFRIPLFTCLIVGIIIIGAGIFWWRKRKGAKPE